MIAIDTNVFVYSIVEDNDAKRKRAMDLITSLNRGNTLLLWQVACEVGAVISRLIDRGKLRPEAYAIVEAVRDRFPLQLPSQEMLGRGLQIRREHQVSYWDAMLIAGCFDAGVTRLYTEDTQGKPVIHGVEFINPFR